MYVVKEFIGKPEHFPGAYFPPIVSRDDTELEHPKAILLAMGPDTDHIMKRFGNFDQLHFSATNEWPTSAIR